MQHLTLQGTLDAIKKSYDLSSLAGKHLYKQALSAHPNSHGHHCTNCTRLQ